MDLDLNQICDVCGRQGHIAFWQPVGPFNIAVCQACQYQGVTSADPVAAEYHSNREQADAKLARHREFMALPGPGEHHVSLRPGAALPRLCCGCMGQPSDYYPLGRSRPGRRRAGCMAALCLAPLLLFAMAAKLPGVFLFVLIILVVVMMAAAGHGRKTVASAPGLQVPVCPACRGRFALATPPARIVLVTDRSTEVSFRNWEYAQLAHDTSGR